MRGRSPRHESIVTSLFAIALTGAIAVAMPPLFAKSVVTIRAPQGKAGSTTLVGFVRPTDARPDEDNSGSLVLDPKTYESVPGVQVTLIQLPLARDENGQATLQGTVVDTGDGTPQPADRGINFHIPRGAGGATNILKLLFSRAGSTAAPVQSTIPLTGASPLERVTASTGHAGDFSSPPVSGAGPLQIIRGPFDGRSESTHVMIDGANSRVIAETPRACYHHLPNGLAPGAHDLTVLKGDRTSHFKTYVVYLRMAADQMQLKRGQVTNVHVTIVGLEQMPEDQWTSGGIPELNDPARMKASMPGYQDPAEGGPGKVMILISNGSPAVITLVGAKDETIQIPLTSQNTSGHPYTYTFSVQAKRDGGFAINASVHPMLGSNPGHDSSNASNPQSDKLRQARQDLESKENEARKASRAADRAAKDAATKQAAHAPGAAQAQQQAQALRQQANTLTQQASQIGTQTQQLASAIPPSTLASILKQEAKDYRTEISLGNALVKKLRGDAGEKRTIAQLKREAAARFSNPADKQQALAEAKQSETDAQQLDSEADDAADRNARLQKKAADLEKQASDLEKTPSAPPGNTDDESSTQINPVTRPVSNISSGTSSQTSSTPSPPTVANSVYTPARQARDRAIAAAFSPIVYQAVGDTPRADMLTNFDFDGDWVGDNNWDHAVDERFPLRAYVYYSVAETPTHFFIHYAFYHARDYKGGLKRSYALKAGIAGAVGQIGGDPTGITDDVALSHENDLEGCMVVALKHGEDPGAGTVLYVEALAHNRYLKYRNPSVRAPEAEIIDLRGEHPLLFAEAKGHGVSRYTGSDQQIKNGPGGMFIYTFTGEAEIQEQTESRDVSYDLLPLYTTMWAHAQHGANETYGLDHNYEILTILISANPNHDPRILPPAGPLGSAFRGDVGFENKSRPPWGWFDMTEKSRPLGEWFFDPAAVIARHYHLGKDFSINYIFNIYLGILR
jgi:hypothetical protein